jgi:hypothetical protein
MSPDLDEFGSPFYLLLGTQDCWKCGNSCRVAGLSSDEPAEESDDEQYEPFTLNNIQAMPDEFLAAIRRIQPSYEKRASKMAGISYFMNVCPCGAFFGDHYLFAEPGGAFFPMDDDEAGEIEVYKLPFKGTYEFTCSAGLGTGRSILEHGKRQRFPAS